MEYQKIKNLLDNTPNQQIKFTTKNWVEINDDARGTYNKDSRIKFKTSMIKSIYASIVVHIYFLKGLYQSKHKQEIIQIMEIKN